MSGVSIVKRHYLVSIKQMNMKSLYAVLTCVILASCAQPEQAFRPEPGLTYQLINPASGTTEGSVVFDQNHGYLLSQVRTDLVGQSAMNTSIKAVGRWNVQDDVLFMVDQVYQSIECFDRWGSPQAVSEHTIEHVRQVVPRSECRKATVSGSELLLL
jgi:hypothetical protein